MNLQQFTSFMFGLRNRHFLVADLLIILIMPAIAMALRYDSFDDVTSRVRDLAIATLVIAAIDLPIFLRGGLYARFWRYASVDELAHVAGLGLLATVLQTLVIWGLRAVGVLDPSFPATVPIIAGLLTLLAIGGVRFSVRVTARMLQRYMRTPSQQAVVIVGAGDAGVLIAQEMQRNPKLQMWPVAFVDDAVEKHGLKIRGIPVMGQTRDISRVCKAAGCSQVIIAIPTAPGKKIREIVGMCEEAGVSTKIIPGMYELLGGQFSVKQLREIRIEDLLRREPIHTDTAAVGDLIRGKRVLITGGGGSIGSELCRQVLRFEPSELVILGHGENSVFEIDNELRRIRDLALARNGNGHKPVWTEIIPVIADIRLGDRIARIFAEHRPEIVFHSAAHKHVPLMEANPGEAITNNVLGTRNLLAASRSVGVQHFVMISTDKAVNPTSVMGASKRVAELLVHQEAAHTGKPYVAVRFGNVLGSRGSVVLTFQQQIAAGGPLTVTDPEMTRFFMTIPEAVQLVLQAATLGKGGEVFMLDMGDPIKILDLARDLIKLSGLEVGRDVDIEISGIRPGEKLFEELFIQGEQYERTRHDKIFIVANASSLVPANLGQAIDSLAAAADQDRQAEIMRGLKALVPEFKPAEPKLDTVPATVEAPPVPARELSPVAGVRP